MLTIDADIPVLSATITTPSPEALETGIPPHVEQTIATGLGLPFVDPRTGNPVILPLGTLRFRFSPAEAVELFDTGLIAARKLPQQGTSGSLIVASNMAEVATTAENIRRVTGMEN